MSPQYSRAQRLAALRRYADGEEAWRIANWLGCTPRTIQSWAQAAHAQRRRTPLTSAEARALYIRWRDTEVTSAILAAEHGYRIKAMHALLRRMHKLARTGDPTWIAVRFAKERSAVDPAQTAK